MGQRGGLYEGNVECLRATICDPQLGFTQQGTCLGCAAVQSDAAFLKRLRTRKAATAEQPDDAAELMGRLIEKHAAVLGDRAALTPDKADVQLQQFVGPLFREFNSVLLRIFRPRLWPVLVARRVVLPGVIIKGELEHTRSEMRPVCL